MTAVFRPARPAAFASEMPADTYEETIVLVENEEGETQGRFFRPDKPSKAAASAEAAAFLLSKNLWYTFPERCVILIIPVWPCGVLKWLSRPVGTFKMTGALQETRRRPTQLHRTQPTA